MSSSRRPVRDDGFGLTTIFVVPGGGEMLLYEPRHPEAYDISCVSDDEPATAAPTRTPPSSTTSATARSCASATTACCRSCGSILPGVQVLLAFLLTVPFAQRFEELDDWGRRSFGLALTSSMFSVVFLLGPTFLHRLGERTARSARLLWSIRLMVGRPRAARHLPRHGDVGGGPVRVRHDDGVAAGDARRSSRWSACGSSCR